MFFQNTRDGGTGKSRTKSLGQSGEFSQRLKCGILHFFKLTLFQLALSVY